MTSHQNKQRKALEERLVLPVNSAVSLRRHSRKRG